MLSNPRLQKALLHSFNERTDVGKVRDKNKRCIKRTDTGGGTQTNLYTSISNHFQEISRFRSVHMSSPNKGTGRVITNMDTRSQKRGSAKNNQQGERTTLRGGRKIQSYLEGTK